MSDPDSHPERQSTGSEPDPASAIPDAPASLPFLSRVVADLASIVEELERLAATGIDRFGVRLRRRILTLLVGLAVALLGFIMAMSLWFSLLRGASGGLAVAMGDRPWAGDLAAGALGFGMLVAGTGIVLKVRRSSRRLRLIQRYERRGARKQRRAERSDESLARDVA